MFVQLRTLKWRIIYFSVFPIFLSGCERSQGYWLAFPLSEQQNLPYNLEHSKFMQLKNSVWLSIYTTNAFYFLTQVGEKWSTSINFPSSLYKIPLTLQRNKKSRCWILSNEATSTSKIFSIFLHRWGTEVENIYGFFSASLQNRTYTLWDSNFLQMRI